MINKIDMINLTKLYLVGTMTHQINGGERVRIGYACINNTVKEKHGITTNSTCRLETVYKASKQPVGTTEYSKEVLSFLIQYGLKNTQAIISILQWHVSVGLRFYRMSSDLFPHIDNDRLFGYLLPEDIDTYRNLTPFKENIATIAEIAYKNNIRITMHPSPYAVLASPDSDKVQNTVTTLKWHARIFQLMEEHMLLQYNIADAFKDSILCLHIGGKYDGKEKTLARWAINFNLLPPYVQKHVCIENCEKSYSAQDLIPLAQQLKIPLIFDFHHYECYPLFHGSELAQLPISHLLPQIINTWTTRNMTPKFHLSDQDHTKCIGAHDEFVACIPTELLDLHLKEPEFRFDVMIEAKAKDYAVFFLLHKYPHLNFTLMKDPLSMIPSSLTLPMVEVVVIRKLKLVKMPRKLPRLPNKNKRLFN
jgi:UV DNA damage endonuclease